MSKSQVVLSGGSAFRNGEQVIKRDLIGGNSQTANMTFSAGTGNDERQVNRTNSVVPFASPALKFASNFVPTNSFNIRGTPGLLILLSPVIRLSRSSKNPLSILCVIGSAVFFRAFRIGLHPSLVNLFHSIWMGGVPRFDIGLFLWGHRHVCITE